MNTGISITISFVIGGLLLLSIIVMNASVIENSGETVLNMSAKNTVETVSQVMTRDILRIGYNTGEQPKKAILSIISNPNPQTHQKIVFKADIDNDDTQTPVKITWEALSSQEITATPNVNDYKLTRTIDHGPEQGISTFAVTNFNFSFLDKDGNTTSTESQIKTVRVSMECEAPAKYGDKKRYERSIWNKTFTPPNLNLENY